MFSITPIGSCRITTPLKRGQVRHGFELNMAKCYGYCHSPAEAVQMAQFMLGHTSIPSDIWPLVSRAHDLNDIEVMSHIPSDLYVIEIASAKEVTIDGVSIQLNYLNATYADFFASKDRAGAFWELAETGSGADKTQFLATQWSGSSIQAKESRMLARISMRRVTQQSLENDLQRLDALLPNVLIVSHIDARKADGQKIESRSTFIRMVQDAAHATQLAFDNPTDLMARFGQSSALEDESAGLAHFTPIFGDALMHNWMRTAIAPITDHAVTSVNTAINDWFVPQLMASFENGEIADAVKRTQNLKYISPSMLLLANEVENIQATSQEAFEAYARTAVRDGMTDEACTALVEEAIGLGQFGLALGIVVNNKSGASNLPQFTSLTLAERAMQSDLYAEALAILEPYLARGHATAIEMFASAYLKAHGEFSVDLPDTTVTKIIAQLDMARRITLINLMGLDEGLVLTPDTTAEEVALAARNIEAERGFAAAFALFASWLKLQDRKLATDPSVLTLLDGWVAISASNADLCDQIDKLSLILQIAPRHAPTREAVRAARQALMVKIRAVGEVGDLPTLNALAPTVAKLPSLPEFDLWRARLSFNNGDYTSAIQLGTRAAVELPDKINLWVLLMRAAHRSDRSDKAVDYAKNVVRLSNNANEKLRVEAQAILYSDYVRG